jgi:hypothetical protein
MDLLIGIAAAVLLIGSAISSIVGNIIASDLYDRFPSLALWLIKRAISVLPEQDASRYREEWLSHLDECPSNIGKLSHAIGCWYGARRLAATLKRKDRNRSPISPSFDRHQLAVKLRQCLRDLPPVDDGFSGNVVLHSSRIVELVHQLDIGLRIELHQIDFARPQGSTTLHCMPVEDYIELQRLLERSVAQLVGSDSD